MVFKHVMVDLETLGTGNQAPILSIGAVEFDPETMKLGDTFYRVVDVSTHLEKGAVVDGQTFYWWLRQNDKVRNSIQPCGAYSGIEGSHIKNALQHFRAFWKYPGHECLWAHGPTFDITILANAYKDVGEIAPWDYRAARDTRTVYDAADMWPNAEHRKLQLRHSDDTEVVEHNALSDAKTQADHLMRCMARIAGWRRIESGGLDYHPWEEKIGC